MTKGEEEWLMEERKKRAIDFAQDIAIMRLQNVMLLKELEKEELVAQECEEKVNLLEKTAKTREA